MSDLTTRPLARPSWSRLHRVGWSLLLILGVLSPLGCTLNDCAAEHPVDRVCGRPVDRSTGFYLSYDRHPYWFDTDECLHEFLAHPATYVDMAHYVFNQNE